MTQPPSFRHQENFIQYEDNFTEDALKEEIYNKAMRLQELERRKRDELVLSCTSSSSSCGTLPPD
jgi:hypothetical protein